jgi:flagellar biosynthesis protein FlhF
MNIRRFVAADMREALSAIRADLGADAVMLSSRKLASGVEVIAAIDYDDSLFATSGGGAAGLDSGINFSDDDDLESAAVEAEAAAVEAAASALVAGEPSEHEQIIAARLAAARSTASSTAVAASAASLEPAAGSMVAEEIKDLRRLLETQLASFAWNDLNRQAPVRARLLRELAKLGVDAMLATELADEIPAGHTSQEAMRAVMRRFGERLPLASWDMADSGGIFAVVGPTGVGKTTSIAKIAARFVLRHSVEELGLVSTDTYRIGARQQLFNFARILRAPMHVAENAHDLRRVLDGFAKKKLVLIDTAGMSQRDVRLANQFATLKVEGHHVQTVLALSAGADRACLAEALSVFKAASPEALIITKLDEAAALGGVLSLAIRADLPVAYLSDGQRVPEGRSGLRRVLVGVESGSQEMIDRIRKDIKLEDVLFTAERCRRHGVAAIFPFIVGFPGESPASVDASLALAKRLRAMSPDFQTPVFYFKPYPGTEITAEAVAGGYRLPTSLDDWSEFDCVGSVGPWVTPATARRIERFRFYQRLAWDRPGGWRRPLQRLARWRCAGDRYALPVEKAIGEWLFPPAELS